MAKLSFHKSSYKYLLEILRSDEEAKRISTGSGYSIARRLRRLYDLTRMMADLNYEISLFLKDGNTVGYTIVSIFKANQHFETLMSGENIPTSAKAAWIQLVYVNCKFRNKNIGSQILSILDNHYRERGYKYLLFETGATNKPFLGLAEKSGYSTYVAIPNDNSGYFSDYIWGYKRLGI